MSIWKLQRPLATFGMEPVVMAYTKKRDNILSIPMTEQDMDDLFGDKPKVYAEAEIINTNLKVNSIVEDQNW